jgi:hypothetical protein
MTASARYIATRVRIELIDFSMGKVHQHPMRSSRCVRNQRRSIADQPWEGWQEPPVLFAAAIGLPSSNKSPALKVITDLLKITKR